MRCIAPLSLAFLIAQAAAQDRAKPDAEPPLPIPAEVFLSDLHEAYSAPFAEELTIRIRTPSGERSDTLIVRIDPGPRPPETGPHPRSVKLELGQLRIHIADGKLTAINTSAPDKFYQRSYHGPITPARIAELLPPLLLPHLAITNSDDPRLASPLELLRGTTWSDAHVDEGTRPLTTTIQGTSPGGSISLTALVSTVRLTKATATVKRPDTEMQVEFTFRPADPGEPAGWVIQTEGKQQVSSLTDLRTTPKPLTMPQTSPAETPAKPDR